ncbi:MAG: 5-formyltetrahydrofolate cyclo-ligase [Gammaproteobacteria bacterium]|nr:5-formyltetrahydrofolate cyclo-ligase [Gammaproteobacteria bacterium]
MHIDKSKVRTLMKLQRRQLNAEYRQLAAESLSAQFHHSGILAAFQHIAVYLSYDNEIDLSLLIKTLWQQNKSCYLPVLHPIHHHELWFAPYSKSSSLKPNKYGILEPECEATQIIAGWELEAVLMPLLAFDQHGHRLGSGGGYYDRSFSFAQTTKSPVLIGCGYEFQYHDNLPKEPWDISIDIAVTEQNTYQFRKKHD